MGTFAEDVKALLAKGRNYCSLLLCVSCCEHCQASCHTQRSGMQVMYRNCKRCYDTGTRATAATRVILSRWAKQYQVEDVARSRRV